MRQRQVLTWIINYPVKITIVFYKLLTKYKKHIAWKTNNPAHLRRAVFYYAFHEL